MVKKGTDNAEVSPAGAVLADSGYWNEEAPKGTEELGTEAYIATGHQPHGKKTPTRSAPPPGTATAQEQMSHKLRAREGLDQYALRKSIAEPVNGQTKGIGGFRRFGLRGCEHAPTTVGEGASQVGPGLHRTQSKEAHRGHAGESVQRRGVRVDREPKALPLDSVPYSPIDERSHSVGHLVLLVILRQCATDCQSSAPPHQWFPATQVSGSGRGDKGFLRLRLKAVSGQILAFNSRFVQQMESGRSSRVHTRLLQKVVTVLHEQQSTGALSDVIQRRGLHTSCIEA
ncbi:MAG: hypothetical protein BRD27_05725 [Bacteroidetes bacterium QH_10_64_19]|nr:MAG: hypothetical protein BRD27_05725 [Bacteroidetes bacterium QH_10_64_19]